jgi:hypothetical protein
MLIYRSQSQRSGPVRILKHAIHAAKRVTRTNINPTLKTARALPDWVEWNTAIHQELDMLKDMGCYEPILKSNIPIDPQTGRPFQIIQSKIDLRLKFDAMGNPTKHKGRLVALGNTEWSDSNRDVYSPTVNTKTINLMLALAAQQGMILYGLDIFGAFITAHIDSPVFVQLPSGVLPPDSEGNPPIWDLRRTLYGLNRSPKAFYDQLTSHLVDLGYKRSDQDQCLFFRLDPMVTRSIFAFMLMILPFRPPLRTSSRNCAMC